MNPQKNSCYCVKSINQPTAGLCFGGCRQLLNSPLLARRLRRGRLTESSDEDLSMSGDEVNGFNRRGSKAPTTDPFLAHNFQDLESFQKAQLLNKVTTWTSKRAVGAFRQFLCQRARVLPAHNSRQKAISAPLEWPEPPGSLTSAALCHFFAAKL